MRLSLLLFGLYQALYIASRLNKPFKKFISKAKVRLMIKIEDGKHARLFVFNRGQITTATGPNHEFDAALVWKDPKTAFSVLLKNNQEAVFYAAAAGKLKIEGMSVYALWFDEAMGHIMN
ncbi:MAG: hypothetical protein QNJ97_05410 [Myxococcota bacterium]|nr:hypothetical protein [Myxococcota bacterium]